MRCSHFLVFPEKRKKKKFFLHISLQDVIGQLQEEKNILVRKVSQRDKQITAYREQMDANLKQISQLQFRLDKVGKSL